MTIKEIQEEIVDEFALFDDWMDRYEHLIALGKSVAKIDDTYKTAEYTIKGCQSKVWLFAEKKDNRIVYSADSDAILTKGIIGLLLRVYSNQPAEEILKSDTDFIDEIGLKEHLSPTRANGLVSMIKQVKLYAIALQSN